MVAWVLGPGRGCGLITLMVSAVGAQLAQEMGHLSLLELMAACGHFSPAAFKQSWERGVSGERWGEGRGGEGKKGEGSERGREERGGRKGGRRMPLRFRPGMSWENALGWLGGAGGWTPGPRSRAPLVHTVAHPREHHPRLSTQGHPTARLPNPHDHRCH